MNPVNIQEKLISVIIPAYNYASLLPRLLDSVMLQRADDMEVIVVNDGSTDETSEVLGQYEKQFGEVFRVVNQVNSGPAVARNKGIAMARGRFILLVDADDELYPETIAHFRNGIQENPGVGMLLGGYLSIAHNGKQRQYLPAHIVGTPVQLIRKYLLSKDISIVHGAALFRKDVLAGRLYPEQLRGTEDLAVFAYMLVAAPVAVIREPLVKSYRHPESLRNLRSNEGALIDNLVAEVFCKLPSSCQSLKKQFRAQRYLSLFRLALMEEKKSAALSFYMKALKTSARQALRWDYLRRVPKLLLS
jgi:glycosyltransferase involved in cell wall biosynthesis